ncbi:MAG: hypothetical protein R8M38_04640 [Mariprofundaceae bacterium]
MMSKHLFGFILTPLFLGMMVGSLSAQESDLLHLNLEHVVNEPASATMMLAANDMEISGDRAVRQAMLPDSHFKAPMMTENELHMYLGLGSLLAAGLAAMTVPERESGKPLADSQLVGFHHKAAWTATFLGVGAVATGFLTHSDELFEEGLFDTDNVHTLLGILGTLGYYLAVKDASSGLDDYTVGTDHATAGILGAVAMTGAIVITW